MLNLNRKYVATLVALTAVGLAMYALRPHDELWDFEAPRMGARGRAGHPSDGQRQGIGEDRKGGREEEREGAPPEGDVEPEDRHRGDQLPGVGTPHVHFAR